MVTNMDTKLGMRHLTKDMQDLLLHKVNIIRDNINFKKVADKDCNVIAS